MNSRIKLLTGSAAGVLAVATATMALAEGTPAGTVITNNVAVDYEVGGIAQTTETASDDLIVDRKIDLVLTEVNSAATVVTPGQTGAVTVFELTNLSNASLDFALSANQSDGGAGAHGGTDNFNVDNGPAIFVDANGNGLYDVGVDTATFVDELSADQTVTIFVLGDIPNTVFGGDIATVELSATAHEAGAAGLGTIVTNASTGPNGSESVLADGSGTSDADSDGTFTARDDYQVDDVPVDLEVEISTDNAAPLAGFDQYTITVTVTNTGTANASGVVVSAPLPGGNGLISDTSGGDWDSDTGEWTIGDLAIGATTSFTYTVSTSAIGSHDATAQIIATDQADIDSDPTVGFGADDLSDSVEDDDEDIAPVTATVGTGTVAAQSCSVGTSEFDWTTRSWTPAALSGTYSLAGKPVAVTITDADGSLISGPPFFTPVNGAFYEGGLGSADEALIFAARSSDLEEDGITITLDLGPDGIGVEELRFALFDIDGNPELTRYEGVTITGSLGGTPVAPMLEGGAQISISGNQARGTADAPTSGPQSGDGTLQVGFSGRVDTVTISWGEAPGTTNTTGQPGFALHNFSICTPPTGLTVNKTSASFDPVNPFRIPGSDVIYSIAITNDGEVPTDTGTLFIVDALPPEVEFFNGDHDGSGPGSDPVGFEQSGTGLTFDYSSDVRFSNSGSAPANIADCSYSPTAGYDPAVTYICVNPKGQLEATDPDSSFTISFRTRIK